MVGYILSWLWVRCCAYSSESTAKIDNTHGSAFEIDLSALKCFRHFQSTNSSANDFTLPRVLTLPDANTAVKVR
jgi:hypothetical protein